MPAAGFSLSQPSSIATEEERDVVLFAAGTGLRAGEQRSLRLADVLDLDGVDPHLVVRYGKPGKPTKGGRVRRVPLFGHALVALRRWIDRLSTFCPVNERGLVFPTASGAVRSEGHMLGRVHVGGGVYVDRWTALAAHAGLFDVDESRPAVWHSLRHTCGGACRAGSGRSGRSRR
jgi:integrase